MSIPQIIRNYQTILKNTGYLSVIEIIRMAMPFIALPYVIRTIGSDKYGMTVFAQTIISYFSIFINFGLDISAVRDVSVHRDQPGELNKIVSAVLGIKFLLFLTAFTVLLLGLLVVPYLVHNRILFLFAFLTCLSEILFPVWFYQGIEKMKYLTLIRTTSILFYTISVFIVVKGERDYEYVVLLQSAGNVLAGLISLYLLLVVNKVRIVWPTIGYTKLIFRKSIPFFFSRLSVVLNNTMAKTVSGIFFSMNVVAAFDLAQKIASVSLIPVQMLNQAVYPHIAKTLNRHFANKFFYLNIGLAFVLAFIVFIGAPYAVNFFAGKQLPEALTLTRILTLWVICGGITTYVGSPVLVSFGYEGYFNKSVIISTISLGTFYGILYILNLFTVYNFAFALVFSEFIILLYRLYYCYHLKIFAFHGKRY